jgi:hypothetical protein
VKAGFVMPSKRSSVVWLLAGFLVLGGCLCWLAVPRRAEANLGYQGKPLPYWFNQLPMTRSRGEPGYETAVQTSRRRAQHNKTGAVQRHGSWVETADVSGQAIRAMGTNGLQFNLSKLERRESALPGKIQMAAFGLGLRRFLFADVGAEREQAVTALILLKPLPENVVRQLTVLSTGSNAEIAGAARCVLIAEASQLFSTRKPGEADRIQLEDKGNWR